MSKARDIIEAQRSAGRTAEWGQITGTIEDQIDLKTTLDNKVDTAITVTGVGALLGGGVLTQDIEIEHNMSDGFRHIPAGGTQDDTLVWSADGAAKWETPATALEIDAKTEREKTLTPYTLADSIVGNAAQPFSPTVAYAQGVIVTYQNIAYRSKTATGPSNFVEADWRDIEKAGASWDASAYYEGGDIVSRNGDTWIATVANVNSDPAGGSGNWTNSSSAGYAAGMFTPILATEYPDTIGETAGAIFVIEGGTYTYTTGPFLGMTVDNGDTITWQGSTAWTHQPTPTISGERGGRQWSSSLPYTAGDIVSDSGFTFLCIADTSNEPVNNVNFWKFLATNPEKGGIAIVPGMSYEFGDVVSEATKSWLCISPTNSTPSSDPTKWIITGAQYHDELHEAGVHIHSDIDTHLDTLDGHLHIPFNGTVGQILTNISSGQVDWMTIDDTLIGTSAITPLSANMGRNLEVIKTDKTTEITVSESITGGGDLSTSRNIGHRVDNGHKHVPAGGAADDLLYWSALGTAQWASATSFIIDDLVSTATNKALSANMGRELEVTKTDKTTEITVSDSITGGGDLSTSRNVGHRTDDGHKHLPAGGGIDQVLYWNALGDAIWVEATSFMKNDLVSTDINKALTAAQGKILQDNKAENTVTVTTTESITGGGALSSNMSIGHLTTSGNKHMPSGGTTTDEVLGWSADGTAVWRNLPSNFFQDSVTSTSTVKALSANQGKLLNDTKLFNNQANTNGLQVTDTESVVLLESLSSGTPKFQILRETGGVATIKHDGDITLAPAAGKIASVNSAEILTTATGVKSDTTGVTGADQILNIISLTQAEHDAIAVPESTTLYVIVG